MAKPALHQVNLIKAPSAAVVAPPVGSPPGQIKSYYTKVMDEVKGKPLQYGLGAGAAVALVLGAPVLLPLALAGGAVGAHYYKKPCMTAERIKIYNQALASSKLTPTQLRSLADVFQKEGCVEQANHLRARAALREAPPEVHAARKEVFRKALNSNNPDAIAKVADAFKKIGADGAAAKLKIREESVRAVHG
jgi:hypothetical protein